MHPRNLLALALAVTAALLLGGCSNDSPEAKPKTAEQLVQTGLQNVQQQNDDAALKAFREAAELKPNNVFAHYNIGVILQKRGDEPGAMQAYGRALAADPKYVPAMFNQATILSKNDVPLAIATYRSIIKLQPVAPTAYLNLGLLEAQVGEYDESRKHLTIALKQDPSLASNIPKTVYDKETPKPSPSS